MTNCTFDGHMYNPQTGDGGVPGDQAGPGLPLGRGVVRLRPLQPVPPPAHGHGRRRRADRALPRPRLPRGVQGVRGKGRQARPEEPEAARHAPAAGPGQGAHPRLPDQLDPQVHVGAPPGLDDPGLGRGLPPGRGAVPGGLLRPHLDLAEPADHRVARRGAAADGAGRLRADHEA